MSVADPAQTGEPLPSAARDRRIFGLPFAFASFLIVGASAFVVNEIALFVLYGEEDFWMGLFAFLPRETDILGLEPNPHLLAASALSVEIAIAWKFLLYENWTFSDRPRRGNVVWRFIQLNAASLIGTIVTVATVTILTPLLGISPYITLAIGVLVAFMLNWLFSNHFIWREHKPAAV